MSVRLREMQDGDPPLLHHIEQAAARLFATVPDPAIAAIAEHPPVPLAEFMPVLSGGPVFVACDEGDQPIGFAAALDLLDCLYLRELSVQPDHQGKGVGSALLDAYIWRARSDGAARCALSTFRCVAFNAPFYRRRGFVELPLDQASQQLRDRFYDEAPEGLDPASRILMVRRP
ncbi:GNAT family N-acetyltransferase [Hoeflea sp. CAU 1731]